MSLKIDDFPDIFGPMFRRFYVEICFPVRHVTVLLRRKRQQQKRVRQDKARQDKIRRDEKEKTNGADDSGGSHDTQKESQ